MSEEVVVRGMERQFTVLFTEDDRLVRDAVGELLRQHGFNVLVAANGEEALRLLAEHSVDLLFADIVMPGMSGVELARRAKELRPDLHVLYLTGHFSQAAGRGVRYGKLLEKPLRADQLLSEVVQALGR
jgi:CheY-like chemotaxis protein